MLICRAIHPLAIAVSLARASVAEGRRIHVQHRHRHA
jgi:hypothetical protein